MTTPGEITVTLSADVNQVDDTGFVWAFLSDAAEPDRVRPVRAVDIVYRIRRIRR